MTVTNQTPNIRYRYTGNPIECAFPFKVFEVTDLAVSKWLDDGRVIPLQLTTHYTVVLNAGGENGGTVSILASAGSVHGYIDISRRMPRRQDTDWINNDPFSTEQLEDDLDRLIMIIQEYGYQLDQAAVYVAWRGEWVTGNHYFVRDMVTGPDSNIYTCMFEHNSVDFFTDLANGGWALMIPVGDMENILDEAEAARDEAIAAAAHAEASAVAAANSQNEAAVSAMEAANSEISAAASELNAANCSVASKDSAIESYNWANTPEDVFVPGTAEYSAYHWKKKAEAIANPVVSIEGTAPISVSGPQSARLINLDDTGIKFVPDSIPQGHNQVLTDKLGVPTWLPAGITTKTADHAGHVCSVHGGVYGGEVYFHDNDTVRVAPFSCMDDTLQVQLVSSAIINIDATAIGLAKSLHVFAVKYDDDSQGVAYGEDYLGADLPANVDYKRFLGMFWTYGGGGVRLNTVNGDTVLFAGPFIVYTGLVAGVQERHYWSDLGHFHGARIRIVHARIYSDDTNPVHILNIRADGTVGTNAYKQQAFGNIWTVDLRSPVGYYWQGSATYKDIQIVGITFKR